MTIHIRRVDEERLLVLSPAPEASGWPFLSGWLDVTVQGGDGAKNWFTRPPYYTPCVHCGQRYIDHVPEADAFTPKCMFDAATFSPRYDVSRAQLFCNRETYRKIKKLQIGATLELSV